MILTPVGALRAANNVRDRVLVGPFADLRRMPRTAIDTGPDRSDALAVGRAHGLARSGSVSTYRYAVHPTVRLRGSPVLLVSPLGACGVAFDLRRGNSLVEHLISEGRYVHQVDDEDLVGHGGTVTTGPADLQRWVDELLPHVVRTVSAHHGGAPVHLVGWSVGGLLATLTAAGHPGLPLASLTALATPFTLDGVPAVIPPKPLALGAGGPLLATLQTLLDVLPMPRLLRILGLTALDELITAPLTILAHLDDRDFLAQLEAVDDLRALVGDQAQFVGTVFRQLVEPADLAAGRVPVGRHVVDLAALTTPTMLVAGEDDLVVPPQTVRLGARRLTGTDVRLTTVPGGHLGLLTGRSARGTTWPQLSAFLDRFDAPPARDDDFPATGRSPARATRRSLTSARAHPVESHPVETRPSRLTPWRPRPSTEGPHRPAVTAASPPPRRPSSTRRRRPLRAAARHGCPHPSGRPAPAARSEWHTAHSHRHVVYCGGVVSLRDARRDRGWSQTTAVARLRELAEQGSVEVASAASLKTQLSRWENGTVPEEPYRTLLAELYERELSELGIDVTPHWERNHEIPGLLIEIRDELRTLNAYLRDGRN